ncbi:porphobilinogen deaminase-like isoform X2 [Rhopilema esculentum]
MRTLGDKILNKALPKIGTKSLFTKDLEVALDEGRVNFLVHSLKDLPTSLPDGMAIGAIYVRDDPYDVVLFHPKYKKPISLKELPDGSVIGTSSLRRIAQLKRCYPHLIFESIRGNLNTRLKKLEEDDKYDAIVLAGAGVQRMKWTDKIGQVLHKDDCLYAVGQGALAVEVKTKDTDLFPLFWSLTDVETLLCCVAERMFLRKLEGGCSVPIGVWCTYEKPKFEMIGAVLSLDGSKCLKRTLHAEIELPNKKSDNYIVTESMVIIDSVLERAVLAAEDVGLKLANELKEDGACEILQQAREQISLAQNDLRLPKSD